MTDVTLSTLRQKRPQPYDALGIKAKVVKIGHTASFRASDGSEKKIMNFSLADQSGAFMASLNDEGKFMHVKEGTCLSIRNFVLKEGKVALHSQTKLRRVADITIETGILESARLLVTPASPVKSLQEIQTAGRTRDIVTVCGQVVKMEAKKTVMVGASASPTEIKTISLSQDGCQVDITLWRELADTDVPLGAFVKMSHCQVGSWQQKKTLNSTRLTTVEQIEAPVSKIAGQLVSYLVGDTMVDIEIENDEGCKDLSLPLTQLARALNLPSEDLDSELATMLPVSVSLQVRGVEVLTITCET